MPDGRIINSVIKCSFIVTNQFDRDDLGRQCRPRPPLLSQGLMTSTVCNQRDSTRLVAAITSCKKLSFNDSSASSLPKHSSCRSDAIDFAALQQEQSSKVSMTTSYTAPLQKSV